MRGRVPALISIKYDRMACSPFGFFRGAVPVMACDLSLGPNTGIFTQLCGDAHVRNLGAFAAPDGRLVFDINDFDETIRGPFEWDVKRMATSLILAGREAGAKHGLCRDAAAAFLASYRAQMHTSRACLCSSSRASWFTACSDVEPISQILRLAERATPLHNLDALTVPAAEAPDKHPPSRSWGHARIQSPRLQIRPTRPHPRPRPHCAPVLDSLATYRRNACSPSAATSSPSTPRSMSPSRLSAPAPLACATTASTCRATAPTTRSSSRSRRSQPPPTRPTSATARTAPSQGRRVVDGQRAMQFQSDPFLGWTTIEGRDYLVRQLNDHKASVALDQLKSAALLEYAAVCGETLARGHARAGDPCAIAGYIGTSTRFDLAIVHFAAQYADQTERDWQALLRSRRDQPAAKPGAKFGARATAITAAAKSRKPAKRAHRKAKRATR